MFIKWLSGVHSALASRRLRRSEVEETIRECRRRNGRFDNLFGPMSLAQNERFSKSHYIKYIRYLLFELPKIRIHISYAKYFHYANQIKA